MLTLLYGALLVGGFVACFALLGACARIVERRA
jgi:hypothetical protein